MSVGKHGSPTAASSCSRSFPGRWEEWSVPVGGSARHGWLSRCQSLTSAEPAPGVVHRGANISREHRDTPRSDGEKSKASLEAGVGDILFPVDATPA